jgi:uncharacterized protein (DUF1015 family)
MVEIAPLRGLRYSGPYSGGAVFAPPYDVISPAQQRGYLARSPYNVVRLILGPTPGDTGWYDEAAATLSRWISGGVLARDPSPVLYGYQQHFALGQGPAARTFVRSGFVARVRLQEWGQGIYRHEQTRVAPRADRLRLMRAVGANLSPVFGLYADPQLELRPRLVPPAQAAVDYRDDEGVRQVFWPIADPAAIAALVGALATRNVVIADGHHRYETALTYRAERRALEGSPAEPQPYDYVLMYLTAAEDPGLCILPTHRVISGGPALDGSTLLPALRRDFGLEPVADPAQLVAAVAAAGRSGVALGACLGAAGTWVLRLKSLEAARQAAGADVADVLAELDVHVLQSLVLAPHMGISRELLATGERVSYTIDAAEACGLVAQGSAQAAFILNPTTIGQVWRAALGGVTMPQKSTYFYPKLLTGLVLNPLAE